MKAALFAAAALAVALAAIPAAAIVSDPPSRVCTQYQRSDAVFIGDVLSETRDDSDEAPIDYSISWRVRVVERFKGALPRVVTIHTSNTSAREHLDVERRHIVFARRAHGGRLNISGGGNTRSGPQSVPIVDAIRRYIARPPAAPTIRGRVMALRAERLGTFLAGAGRMRLEFTNGRGEIVRGRSDAGGRFLQPLTPGTWRVRVAEPGWSSRTGDYSYQDIGRIPLGRSGCADVQILATQVPRRA
jgi:hypothetical protein